MRTPIPALDLIVQNDRGEILFGKVAAKWQDSGKYEWGLPGREILFGESLLDAAKRTLAEETGLTLIEATFVSLNSNLGFGNHYLSIGLLVRAEGNVENICPQDWESWEWFPPTALPALLFPSAEQTLESFKRGVPSLAF